MSLEVLTEVLLKIHFFRDVTLCGVVIFSPLISNQSTTYSVYADVLAVLESNL